MRPASISRLALAGLAVVASLGVPAIGANAAGPTSPSGSASRAALRYWTPARMSAARPMDAPALPGGTRFARSSTLDSWLQRVAPRRGTPQVAVTGAYWTGGGAVARTTGKVFFSMGPYDYVCSGSAVDSPDRSTVLTAGHCVFDPETGTAATNWIFVPGYADGRAPYGVFPATHLATTSGWGASEDFDVDVAFADVAPDASGVRLGDAVGGQPIGFDVPRGRPAYAFGYPAEAPWTGERLVDCAGTAGADTTPSPTTDQSLACTMTPGSSGGPWFSSFDPRTGTGTLTSVTSFSYVEQPGVLYGPYLGSVAHALYTSVASTPGV